MTETQKQRALNLRERNYSYAKISTEIGVSENTVKSFFRRNSEPTVEKSPMFCAHCGKQIEFIPGKKLRKFCSGKCRVAWWRLNIRKKDGTENADEE